MRHTKRMLAFLLAALLAFGLTSCGRNSVEPTEKDMPDAKSNQAAKPSEDDFASDKLYEIEEWVVEDLWNKGFCELGWYAYQGTGSTGNTLDIDMTIQEMQQAIEKKANYDQFISGLNGSQYDQIKSIWQKLSAEIDTLNQQVKEKPPVAKDNGTSVDTGAFQQYQKAFSDAAAQLN